MNKIGTTKDENENENGNYCNSGCDIRVASKLVIAVIILNILLNWIAGN
jgi:hypothetical protein